MTARSKALQPEETEKILVEIHSNSPIRAYWFINHKNNFMNSFSQKIHYVQQMSRFNDKSVFKRNI